MINMIFGRESLGRDSLGKKKANARHVFSISTNKHLQHQPITFIPEDKKGVSYPYNDPMVVVVDIDGFIIKRILVDS